MKNKLFILCLVIGFAACKENNTEVTPDNQKYTITVQNGAGNGEFNADDSVFVWSNPPAGNQVFDKWTGDVSTLANANEWKTKLKVPAANIALTATYKTVTNFTLVQETINGSRVYYYVPAGYKGIVLAFHGKGGNASVWAGGSVDYTNFIRYAVGNDYAVLITESKDRINREWDNTVTNTNVDVLNIDAILGNLHQRSILDSSKSKYAIGMSQGAGFASLISFGRKYKAAALYCLKGIDTIASITKVPIIWNMAPNDVTQEPTRIADALLNYSKLVARNIPASFNFNTPSPMVAKLFEFTTISATDATGIIANLKATGWLDEKGNVLRNPRADGSWIAAMGTAYSSAKGEVEDIIYVCYGEHKFYMDANYKTTQFFNRFQ
jgi:hypothetical protein